MNESKKILIAEDNDIEAMIIEREESISIKNTLLIVLFGIFSMASIAQAQLISWSFFKSDYADSYKDEGESIGAQFLLPSFPDHHLLGGYTFTERKNGDGTKLRKNNFSFGDTWAPVGNSYYIDAHVDYAGSTPVGATSMYGLTPHTTYFKDWDLGLGLQNASYQTGSIFVVNPQVTYLNGPWIFGFGSWIFYDSGSHATFREFARYTTTAKLKIEGSVASGETREDLGLIDHFTAYSVNVSKFWKSFGLGAMAEHYEGKLRQGNSFQVEFQWQW